MICLDESAGLDEGLESNEEIDDSENRDVNEDYNLSQISDASDSKDSEPLLDTGNLGDTLDAESISGVYLPKNNIQMLIHSVLHTGRFRYRRKCSISSH
jgi:hypothetical protein